MKAKILLEVEIEIEDDLGYYDYLSKEMEPTKIAKQLYVTVPRDTIWDGVYQNEGLRIGSPRIIEVQNSSEE